jgi:hypothetical protein
MIMEKQIIENFIAAWNHEDNSERHRLLQMCFSDDGSYVDPHTQKKLKSLNELHFFINKFRIAVSSNLTIIGEPDFHHENFRFRIKMEAIDNSFSQSTFVGEFYKNKIKSIIGFSDS